ncbi:Heterochromatin protein 1 [Orchesella cincta]|uniref:Heterochromatin protein 1 n=1 Tax=Orchesella cincta TaxID=48709 RepID=A0A1D2MJV7_ORCCI|nr:Heterochromatin protein 1 [Orchesella cincta]
MGTYLVEEIVNKRYRRGKAQYLIKWTGYGHHDNSWEPMEHLVGSEIPALIAEFENKRMEKVSAASKQPKLPVATSSKSRKHADLTTQTQQPRKKSATATATSNNSSSSSIEEDAGGANDITVSCRLNLIHTRFVDIFEEAFLITGMIRGEKKLITRRKYITAKPLKTLRPLYRLARLSGACPKLYSRDVNDYRAR